MRKAVLGLVAAVIALAASAQTMQDPARPEAEKTKPPAAAKKDEGRKGGRINRSPTNTRIKDEGIKLPPCAVESRESVDCPK